MVVSEWIVKRWYNEGETSSSAGRSFFITEESSKYINKRSFYYV